MEAWLHNKELGGIFRIVNGQDWIEITKNPAAYFIIVSG